MTLTPTPEQAQALDAYLSGQSLVLDALAGTGKTTVLEMLANATPKGGFYSAFNKALVTDAKGKFPTRVGCRTMHSLAFGAAGKPFAHRLNSARQTSAEIARRLRIDPIWVDYEGERKVLQPARLAGEVLQAAARFCNSDDPEPTVDHFAYIDGIDMPAEDGKRRFDNNRNVRTALLPALRATWEDWSNPKGSLRYSHDAYLKLAQLEGMDLHAEVVMFDEYQDASPVMAAIVEAQRCQLVRVGDENQAIYGFRGAVGSIARADADARVPLTQCQPAGTMVRVPVHPSHAGITGSRPTQCREVPIETLGAGDKVVTWKREAGLLRDGRRITDVNVRPHDGPVVVASAAGHTSRYAPNHECVVVLGGHLDEGDQVVYMMRRAGQYRIGRCPWRYSNGVAPVRRAIAEGADALWVLSVHGTVGDAAMAEALAQVRFGVPSAGWAEHGHYKMPLYLFWSKIGDNRPQAEACLLRHGLLIDHPLWVRAAKPGGGWTTQVVTAAANLRSGMRVMVPGVEAASNGSAQGFVPWSAWSPVTVSTEWYTGLIYSLSVDVEHTYVADGIVTHNSFRFGPAIAEVANVILELLPTNLRVRGYEPVDSRVDHLEGEVDAVLCRTNAAAVSEVLNLQKAGVAVHLVGGGAEVVRFARAADELKDHGFTAHRDLACFTSWSQVEDYVSQDAMGSELRLMVRLVEKFGTDVIIKALDGMIPANKARTVVSTAHKAKGLQWPTVRLASDFPTGKDRAGEPEDPSDEEMRLLYVAATRAQNVLDPYGCGWLVARLAPEADPTPAPVSAPTPAPTPAAAPVAERMATLRDAWTDLGYPSDHEYIRLVMGRA